MITPDMINGGFEFAAGLAILAIILKRGGPTMGGWSRRQREPEAPARDA